jgi:hypothetical protein
MHSFSYTFHILHRRIGITLYNLHVYPYTFFIVHQNTTIINNSSTSHVQMGSLEVQFYYMFWFVEPSSGNTYRQQFLKLLNCNECEYIL